jgi:bacteriocin biosynthesis cyclodehydratase domain-containing protein
VSEPRLVLAGTGAFGEAVTRMLAASRPDAVHAQSCVDAMDRAFDAGAQAAVLAMWRPSVALSEEIDDLVHRNGRAWLPVVFDHPHVLVGPWSGHGSCFRCYRRRRAQHDAQHAVRSRLESAYDRDPSLGPGGYLPHHVRTAAALAERALRRASPPTEVAQVNILSGRTSAQQLTPVHGCPRCRPEPPDAHRSRNAALAELVTGGRYAR